MAYFINRTTSLFLNMCSPTVIPWSSLFWIMCVHTSVFVLIHILIQIGDVPVILSIGHVTKKYIQNFVPPLFCPLVCRFPVKYQQVLAVLYPLCLNTHMLAWWSFFATWWQGLCDCVMWFLLAVNLSVHYNCVHVMLTDISCAINTGPNACSYLLLIIGKCSVLHCVWAG